MEFAQDKTFFLQQKINTSQIKNLIVDYEIIPAMPYYFKPCCLTKPNWQTKRSPVNKQQQCKKNYIKDKRNETWLSRKNIIKIWLISWSFKSYTTTGRHWITGLKTEDGTELCLHDNKDHAMNNHTSNLIMKNSQQKLSND